MLFCNEKILQKLKIQCHQFGLFEGVSLNGKQGNCGHSCVFLCFALRPKHRKLLVGARPQTRLQLRANSARSCMVASQPLARLLLVKGWLKGISPAAQHKKQARRGLSRVALCATACGGSALDCPHRACYTTYGDGEYSAFSYCAISP